MVRLANVILILYWLQLVQNIEAVRFPEVLTLEERLRIFATGSTLNLPDFELITVKEINNTQYKQFRKRPPNVLQYELTLDNETFSITLKPNRNLLAPGCLVRDYRKSSIPKLYPCESESVGCFYTGNSNAHNESWVAANVCGGLRGVVSIGNRSIYIHPVHSPGPGRPETRTLNGGLHHIMYRYQSDKRFDISINNGVHILQPDIAGRTKRSSSTKYLETSLVVDAYMINKHQTEEIHQYVFTMANIAYKVLRDPTIGQDIQFVVNELVLLDSNAGFDINVDADKTLNEFCHWKQRIDDKEKLDDKPLKQHDINVFLTGLDIELEHKKNTNGLATTRGVCQSFLKCAIVEDSGPTMGITLAHEIGHLLGMSHDNTANPCDPMMMAEIAVEGPDGFKWSKCSARELQNTIENNKATCMNNEPEGWGASISRYTDLQLPGIIYDGDKQCVMLVGEGALQVRQKGDPCGHIACQLPSDKGFGSIYDQAMLDGSDCNNTRTWCMGGRCVPISGPQSVSPLDGAWSAWSGYSDCSATCGGGVKIRSRTCTNPRPKYGGKQCSNDDKRMQLCNLTPCMKEDMRVAQCTHRAASFRSNFGTWAPDLTHYGDASCIMRCIRTHILPNGSVQHDIVDGSLNPYHIQYFNDGSDCQFLDLNSPFSRCINGKCQRFGCDGIMNSALNYDVCGRCAGNGTTCRKVSKVYSGRIRHITSNNFNKHQAVVYIPEKSTSIVIQQNHTDLYLEIRTDNDTILSDPSVRTTKLYFERGMRILYEPRPEAIRLNGPTTTSLVVLVTVKQYHYPNPNDYFGVSYTYHTPLETIPVSKYFWALTSVQPCSLTCGGGFMHKKIECWSTTGPVDEYLCDINDKPREEPDPCNSFPCPPRWVASRWSRCSVTCGAGSQTRRFRCEQFINGNDTVVDSTKCSYGHGPTTVSCSRGQCPGVWKTASTTECSRSCGIGSTNRTFRCYANNQSSVAIDDVYCLLNKQPPAVVECNKGPCFRKPSGQCADVNVQCPLIGPDLCYGRYRSWADLYCRRTCGICSDADPPICQTYINYHTEETSCRQYKWVQEQCPNMCNRYCNGCSDNPAPNYPCQSFNMTYCSIDLYKPYLKKRCPQYCCFCAL